MKQKLLRIAATMAIAALTATSRATIYTDATGDLHNGVPTGANFTGFAHLDITSIEVTNTASDLVFKIKFAGNPVATDWGKYMIGIQVTNAGNVFDTAGNGWARPISIDPAAGPAGGMDYWIGSWADGGNGAELRKYTGVWALQSATYNPNPDALNFTKDTNSVTIRFAYSGLGVGFGDTIFFDAYSSGGGGGDSAVDALSKATAAITDWAGPFVSTSLSNYTLQVVTAVDHKVKFAVDMGVPIWDYNNANGDGFRPPHEGGTDQVYVRGSFNGWAGTDELIREGNTTVYTNTVTVTATPGDIIQYKFEGVFFPGYETPLLSGGANRTLPLTNLNIALPTVCFSDRCLSDPPVSTVKLAVDMSIAKRFGVFDPTTNGVSLAGSFNGWNTSASITADAAPNDNVYTNTLTYRYYPLGAQNVGFYKFYITNLVNDYRDNGWEAPISTGGGNRSFGIASANQTLSFKYNDENPVINAAVQQLNPSDVRISFNSFPSRGGFPGYPTGGVYAVESATSLSGPWTTNTIIYSTTANSSTTNLGVLPGTPAQFYRVGLIGF